MTTRRRNPRRRIGGDIWNSYVDQIRKSAQTASKVVGRINKILAELHRLFEEKKNIPFMGAWIFHLSNIATGLTDIQTELAEILQAIEEIDRISQAVAKERQEQLTIVKPEQRKAG